MFGKPSAGIQHQELLSLPMALLVPEKSRIKSEADLWKQDRIEEPLICLETVDAMCRCFQHELQRRKIEWYPTLELASLDLVAEYAAQGFGVGLVIDQPDCGPPDGTRRLRLDGFPLLNYVAMWHGKHTPLLDLFLQGASEMAEELRRLANHE